MEIVFSLQKPQYNKTMYSPSLLCKMIPFNVKTRLKPQPHVKMLTLKTGFAFDAQFRSLT